MPILFEDGPEITKVGDFIAEVGKLDRENLAYVVIATDWTQTDGMRSWANTPDPSEVIALVHLWLAALTKGNLTGVPVYLI